MSQKLLYNSNSTRNNIFDGILLTAILFINLRYSVKLPYLGQASKIYTSLKLH